MFNPDKYLTVKWQMGARVYPILDCYGLIHEVRKDLGLDIWPDFNGVVSDDGGMNREAQLFRSKVSECHAQEGAVAACFNHQLVVHLAIVVYIDGQLMVMESQKGTNVTIMTVQRFERRYRNQVRYFK